MCDDDVIVPVGYVTHQPGIVSDQLFSMQRRR